MATDAEPRTTASGAPVASGAPAASGARTSLLDPEFIRRLEQLRLVTRKITAGRIKGERRSRRKGTSVEFADYRSYVAGDDLRFIDWNIYGRLDRLFLKLFLEEEDLQSLSQRRLVFEQVILECPHHADRLDIGRSAHSSVPYYDCKYSSICSALRTK